MFNLTLTNTNNPTKEYGIIFLAKAIHTPTKEDYFVFNKYIQPQNAFIKKNNLYDYFETSNCILMSTNTYHMSHSTLHRLKHNKDVSTKTLNDLCRILQCDICDLVKYVPSDTDQAL